MNKNAIILHGKPSKKSFYDVNFPSTSNYYWLPWLQKQLVAHDIPTHTPEVPNNWIADYEAWRQEFERYPLSPGTILIGHSCGGGFLLRWLSEHPEITVDRLVLAAPWLDPKRLENTGSFFDFELDPSLASRAGGLTIIYSDNDESSVLETVEILKSKFPNAKFMELQGRGHFYDGNSMEFPEVLEEALV